jgi:hypothetical protein
MTCKKDAPNTCRGDELKIRLVDNEGQEWGEATWIFSTEYFATQESVRGGTAEGWLIFEFPTAGQRIDKVKVWATGHPNLYAQAP